MSTPESPAHRSPPVPSSPHAGRLCPPASGCRSDVSVRLPSGSEPCAPPVHGSGRISAVPTDPPGWHPGRPRTLPLFAHRCPPHRPSGCDGTPRTAMPGPSHGPGTQRLSPGVLAQARLSVELSLTCLPVPEYRPCFLPTVRFPEHPLPSAGSAQARLPHPHRYYRVSPTPRFPSAALRSPSGRRTTVAYTPGDRSVGSAYLLPPLSSGGALLAKPWIVRHCGGENEVSQVPGEPLPACPALRPRRDLTVRPFSTA